MSGEKQVLRFAQDDSSAQDDNERSARGEPHNARRARKHGHHLLPTHVERAAPVTPQRLPTYGLERDA